MIQAFASLPGWVLFPVMVAIGISITFLFDMGVRRYVSPETRGRASPTAAVTLQVVATIYAILIAFVVVDEYTAIRSAQSEMYDKVSALSVVFENSREFPEAKGEPVRDAALAYAHSVVNHGLPKLEGNGKPDRFTDQRLEELYRSLQQIQPENQADQAAYTETLDALDTITRTRQNLINSAGAASPDELIWMLALIGITVMAVATMLDTQHRRSHLFILSALALVIWMTLALVVTLDYPFDGIIRVSDEPVREFIAFRSER